MNARLARQVLRGCRPGGEDDGSREMQAAIRLAEKTPALQADFRTQLAFDRALAEKLDEELPEELSHTLADAAQRLERGRARRFSFRDPAMLAVGLAFLILVAALAWVFSGRAGAFAGRQEVIDLVGAGDNANPDQFEVPEGDAPTAAILNDWFMVRSFDGFAVPAGMQSAPVIGARIYRSDGVAIGVAAVARPESLWYVFDASAFGISLPKGEWRIAEFGRNNQRALGVTQFGNMAFVIALREGGKAELNAYLKSVGQLR